ncbi:MAG: GEVED domain-containing protein [Pirellulaceae bacterium]
MRQRCFVHHNGGTTGALLSAWIDFNKDGDWDDAGEQILMDFVVPPGASSTSLTELVVPATAAHGQTFVRVRISTQAELAPRGLARDGEVEDFAVSIQIEGGGVLNQQTILLNNSEEIVSQQTDLNIPGVAPSILDGVDLTDQNAIRSALIAAGVDPASIAININRRDDGQTVMTDTVVDISEEPGTVWIGNVDDPNTITVISGQLNIITTITTTTTRRFTDVLTITGELVMRRPTADLSLVVTVDNGSAAVGQNVIFTIALNNAGPDAATGVTVLDKLPAGLQFVNATTASGNYNSESGMWTVGGLPVGGTSRLTITAKLLTDQAVSNVAEVASSDQFDPDSTPGNGALAEDDQFSAGVGTCLTGGPLVAGMNRLVFSCVTPGGFAAFVVGSQLGSHYYSKWGTTVDMADPGVPAIGIGNSSGSAVVLVNLTEAQLAQPLYIQAFEMLPAHKVSNLLVAQNMPDHSGIPLLAESIGLGTSPDTLPALQAATPELKAAAIARWQAAGVSQLLADHLATIDILFSDLPNDQLAATQGNFIVLDTNAAGHGWFVDGTPNDNSEFTLDASGALLANTSNARGHIDALTVIMHELGHVLGEADQPNGSANPVMSGSLSPGLRRLPTTIAIPSIDALDVNRDGLVTPIDALLIINELNIAQGRLGRTTVNGHVLDVTGDGLLTPIDVLQVVNYLNRVGLLNRGASTLTGSGEGEDAGASAEFER